MSECDNLTFKLKAFKSFLNDKHLLTIETRFKMLAKLVREDPRFLLEQRREYYLSRRSIFGEITGRDRGYWDNFERAIHLYHAIISQNQAKLFIEFKAIMDAIIEVLENNEFEDWHDSIATFLHTFLLYDKSPTYGYLLKALKHSSKDVRLHLLEALPDRKPLPHWFIPYFGKLLLSEPDPEVREKAASKLDWTPEAQYLAYVLRHYAYCEAKALEHYYNEKVDTLKFKNTAKVNLKLDNPIGLESAIMIRLNSYSVSELISSALRFICKKGHCFILDESERRAEPLAIFTDGRVVLLIMCLSDGMGVHGELGLWGTPIGELKWLLEHLPSRNTLWDYGEMKGPSRASFFIRKLFWNQERISCSLITGGTFSADGHAFAVTERDCIYIFVCPHSQSLKMMKIQCPISTNLYGISLSPDGRYLAARYGGRSPIERITIWDISAQSPYLRHQMLYKAGLNRSPFSPFNPIISFSPDSRLIAVPHFHHGLGGFGIYNVDSRELVHAVYKKNSVPQEAHFSRDGKKLIGIVREGIHCLLIVWDIETAKVDPSEVFHLDEILEGMKELYFSPYGEYIAGLREPDKVIQLFAPSQGLVLTLSSTPQRRLIGFSPDGLYLASVSFEGEIHIWALRSLLGL